MSSSRHRLSRLWRRRCRAGPPSRPTNRPRPTWPRIRPRRWPVVRPTLPSMLRVSPRTRWVRSLPRVGGRLGSFSAKRSQRSAGQAQVQQDRVATGLRALGDQLSSMAHTSQDKGVATDLAAQAAEKAHQFAGWLEQRDPGSVLDEVRAFARHRPGAFLAIALGAGVVTGRLVRGLTADPDTTSPTGSATSQAPSHRAVDQGAQTPALDAGRVPAVYGTPAEGDALGGASVRHRESVSRRADRVDGSVGRGLG